MIRLLFENEKRWENEPSLQAAMCGGYVFHVDESSRVANWAGSAAYAGQGLQNRWEPIWFDRLPVETGQIQIRIQKTQFNRFVPVYRPVRPVYRPVRPVYQVGLNGPSQFFSFSFFVLNLNAQKVC